MDIIELTDKKLSQLQEEYDLSDLAANDRILLQNLAEAMATLDVYNQLLADELGDEIVDVNRVKNIQSLITDAIKNITSLSDSLKIDRKSREKKTESVPDYIRDLKVRARHFIEQRFSYIYCPHCKTLNATMWMLDYNAGSKFKFTCSNCKQAFIINDFELEKRKNVDTVVVPLGQE